MQKENIKFVILTVIILLVITIFLVIVIFNMQETRPIPVGNTLEHQTELHEKEKKWLEHIRQVEEAENGHIDNQSTRDR